MSDEEASQGNHSQGDNSLTAQDLWENVRPTRHIQMLLGESLRINSTRLTFSKKFIEKYGRGCSYCKLFKNKDNTRVAFKFTVDHSGAWKLSPKNIIHCLSFFNSFGPEINSSNFYAKLVVFEYTVKETTIINGIICPLIELKFKKSEYPSGKTE